jgi:hypothetical protein
MKYLFPLCFAAVLLFAAPARAQYIEIRLSYKAVLNPSTGQRAQNFTDEQIDQAIAQMNQLHAGNKRGFRFVRVEPVWNIGSLGDTTGPSRWFNSNFSSPNNGLALRDQMEAAARNDTRYLWNNSAINIYLTGGLSGGLGSRPGHDIVLLGGAIAGDGARQLRTIGHYFDVCDIQGCACGDCGPNAGQCNTPGDDGLYDTPSDLPCWDQNASANYNYGAPYASLSPGEQADVDTAFFNLMSPRGAGTRLTRGQLDRWTDTASVARRSVTTGRTWYVQGFANPCAFHTGYSECGLFLTGGPLGGLLTATELANPAGGDVLRIVSSVNETDNLPRTYSKPATWRNGVGYNITIGRP